MCWYSDKTNLTLEEYKEELEEIKKFVSEELREAADDEVFGVIPEFRDDVDLVNNGVWQRVFKSYRDVLNYIEREIHTFDDEDEEEPFENRVWWSVSRYKLIKDRYKEIMRLDISLHGEIIGIYLDYYYGKYSPGERGQQLETDNYLLGYPRNVILPYKRGDILKINALPFAKPFYAVYGGEGEKGERLEYLKDDQPFHKFCFYHNCLYISEDRNGLDIDDLADSTFTDFAHLTNPALARCEKVSDCPDPLLVRASQLLKEEPDLWYKWIDIKYQHSACEGGLEQWMFTK